MCSKISVVFLLCVSFSCINSISGYKILGVFPFYSPSHYFLGGELLKGLAEVGHDVTMYTVFEDKNPPKNGKYKLIYMEELVQIQKNLFGQLTNLSSTSSQNWFKNPFAMINNFRYTCDVITESTLKNTEIQKLIKSKEHFDVLIVPQFFTEATKALAPHLGAHLVLFTNSAMNGYVGQFVGYASLPSLDSEILLGYIGQMTFQQRLINTLLKLTTYFINTFLTFPNQQKLVDKYISKNIDLTEVQHNVSLVLSNSHTSLSRAQGSVPVIKNIAGFHVRPPKQLPEELKKYLDDAKNGVIYFSMGSNLRGADLPMKTREDLMKAFSKRKEKILWKFEIDEMPGKPDNVRIEKWLPQSDILAHPNVKLFITHGGFLSNIETVYHGVPTIALPVIADQLKNAKTAEADGYTLIVDFTTINEEIITSALEEVITNKKYAENAKYRSKIFHDRQVKPLEEAVYWVEYIVRHNGAKHLRVDYLKLYWYQYYLLDVFAFISIIILLVIFIAKKIISSILNLFRKKTNKKTDKKKRQ